MSPASSPGSPLELTDVLARLMDLGPPSEIRAQSPRMAANVLGLDRVLLSSIRSGTLTPAAVHDSTRDSAQVLVALRKRTVRLEYPLIEGEIMRQRRPRIVEVDTDESVRRCAFADVMLWSRYAVAPVLFDGQVTGFLHGDRLASGALLEDEDAVALASFAVCFGIVYERAVLRHRLRVQHQEMRQMASWADARTSELGDRSITLDEHNVDADRAPIGQPDGGGESALRDLLTRREHEVLKLMVRGETNSGIARELVVSEGTVKFHVKNVLRKLHAANRAEATSRYLRLTLGRTNGTTHSIGQVVVSPGGLDVRHPGTGIS